MRKPKSMALRPRSVFDLSGEQGQASAEKTFYFWVNYYVHSYLPARFGVEPPRFLTTVRDFKSYQEAAVDWISHIARSFLAQSSDKNTTSAPKAFGFKSRVFGDTALRRYLDMLKDCFGELFGLNRAAPSSISAETREFLDGLARNPVQTLASVDFTPQFVLVQKALEAGRVGEALRLPEEIEPQVYSASASSRFSDTLASKLAALQLRANAAVGDIDYAVALQALHNEIGGDIASLLVLGMAKNKRAEIEKGYQDLLARGGPFAARSNAKKQRRGTRPQVEERRVMREEMRDLFNEQLHDERLDSFYTLFSELAFDSYDLQDALQALSAIDLSQLTTAEFEALSNSYGKYAAGFRGSSHSDVPAFRRLSSFQRQERLLDPSTRAMFADAQVDIGRRVKQLPDFAWRFITPSPDGSMPALDELIQDLGTEGAAKLLWYMSRDVHKKPFDVAIMPAHLTAHDFIGLNYGEYTKLVQEFGLENANIYNLRAIRLFGTLAAFKEYLSSIDPNWGARYKHSLSRFLHDDAGLASLNLPQQWKKGKADTWNRAGWIDFVMKYKAEGMPFIANAPMYQAMFKGKVPADINELVNRLDSDDPERAIMRYPKIPTYAHDRLRELFAHMRDKAPSKYFKDDEVFAEVTFYSVPWGMSHPWEMRVPYLAADLKNLSPAERNTLERRTYVFKQLSRKSPLNAFIGALPAIDDCMYIGGPSESLIERVCQRPDYGMFIVEEVAPTGVRFIGAAAPWFINKVAKKICIDSVELDYNFVGPGKMPNDWYYTVYNYLLAQVSVNLVEKHGFSLVTIGTSAHARIQFSRAESIWNKALPPESPTKFGGSNFEDFKPRRVRADEFIPPDVSVYTDAHEQFTYLPPDFANKTQEKRVNRARRNGRPRKIKSGY